MYFVIAGQIPIKLLANSGRAHLINIFNTYFTLFYKKLFTLDIPSDILQVYGKCFLRKNLYKNRNISSSYTKKYSKHFKDKTISKTPG